MDKKYAWAFEANSMNYTGRYRTIEECLEDATKSNFEYKKIVYIGELTKYETEIDIDKTVDNLHYDACGNLGEIAEDFLSNISSEQLEELETGLNEFYKKWIKKHNLELYFIEEIKKYNLGTGEFLAYAE